MTINHKNIQKKLNILFNTLAADCSGEKHIDNKSFLYTLHQIMKLKSGDSIFLKYHEPYIKKYQPNNKDKTHKTLKYFQLHQGLLSSFGIMIHSLMLAINLCETLDKTLKSELFNNDQQNQNFTKYTKNQIKDSLEIVRQNTIDFAKQIIILFSDTLANHTNGWKENYEDELKHWSYDPFYQKIYNFSKKHKIQLKNPQATQEFTISGPFESISRYINNNDRIKNEKKLHDILESNNHINQITKENHCSLKKCLDLFNDFNQVLPQTISLFQIFPSGKHWCDIFNIIAKLDQGSYLYLPKNSKIFYNPEGKLIRTKKQFYIPSLCNKMGIMDSRNFPYSLDFYGEKALTTNLIYYLSLMMGKEYIASKLQNASNKCQVMDILLEQAFINQKNSRFLSPEDIENYHNSLFLQVLLDPRISGFIKKEDSKMDFPEDYLKSYKSKSYIEKQKLKQHISRRILKIIENSKKIEQKYCHINNIFETLPKKTRIYFQELEYQAKKDSQKSEYQAQKSEYQAQKSEYQAKKNLSSHSPYLFIIPLIYILFINHMILVFLSKFISQYPYISLLMSLYFLVIPAFTLFFKFQIYQKFIKSDIYKKSSKPKNHKTIENLSKTFDFKNSKFEEKFEMSWKDCISWKDCVNLVTFPLFVIISTNLICIKIKVLLLVLVSPSILFQFINFFKIIDVIDNIEEQIEKDDFTQKISQNTKKITINDQVEEIYHTDDVPSKKIVQVKIKDKSDSRQIYNT